MPAINLHGFVRNDGLCVGRRHLQGGEENDEIFMFSPK